MRKQCESNHNHNHNHSKKVTVKDTVTQKKRGTRLPDDWFPKPEEKIDMLFTPDQLQNHFDSFRDYWISKPGRDGVKLDWQATWRNWLRNSRQNYRSPGGKSKRTQINEALADWINTDDEQEKSNPMVVNLFPGSGR